MAFKPSLNWDEIDEIPREKEEVKIQKGTRIPPSVTRVINGIDDKIKEGDISEATFRESNSDSGNKEEDRYFKATLSQISFWKQSCLPSVR